MCMPLAFAMALDMPVADILAAIGHDGSEIVFPTFPSRCAGGASTSRS